jgi:hypothetical protein
VRKYLTRRIFVRLSATAAKRLSVKLGPLNFGGNPLNPIYIVLLCWRPYLPLPP